ncbi:hypothetical protein Nisw_01280 [Candidatus Nitrosopumilus sp. SW]|uniref:hypothetical protein n=1 Tax=Candidatus Nitrosopumilus sp. SW TaxID=2508726 RepID=UPI0011535E62|nr:hypothetical protein [Candidatus Nitrosopumilus sp. SW]QDI88258.1 hypothetical protein Nisw_01280 [Candidatus Nitrosopumilus sp. SW]
MKNIFLSFVIILFSTMILASLTINYAEARADLERCGFFEVNENCDLSGLYHLILGDVIIGGILGAVFFVLTERNNRAIQKIIASEKSWSDARRDFAVRNMKDALNTIMFISGRIKKLTEIYNKKGVTDPKEEIKEKIKDEEAVLQRFLQTARNGLIYSSDVFDPVVMYQIEGMCTFISQMSTVHEGEKILFPKYNDAILKIKILYKQLQTYRNLTHSFEEYVEE